MVRHAVLLDVVSALKFPDIEELTGKLSFSGRILPQAARCNAQKTCTYGLNSLEK